MPPLQTLVRSMILDLAMQGKSATVVQVLEGLLDGYPQWLSAEAAQLLGVIAPAERGGPVPQAQRRGPHTDPARAR